VWANHDNLKQQGPKRSTMNILDGEVTYLLQYIYIYIYIIPQSTIPQLFLN